MQPCNGGVPGRSDLLVVLADLDTLIDRGEEFRLRGGELCRVNWVGCIDYRAHCCGVDELLLLNFDVRGDSVGQGVDGRAWVGG